MMTTTEITLAALSPLIALALAWGAMALAGLMARWAERLDDDFKTRHDDED